MSYFPTAVFPFPCLVRTKKRPSHNRLERFPLLPLLRLLCSHFKPQRHKLSVQFSTTRETTNRQSRHSACNLFRRVLFPVDDNNKLLRPWRFPCLVKRYLFRSVYASLACKILPTEFNLLFHFFSFPFPMLPMSSANKTMISTSASI